MNNPEVIGILERTGSLIRNTHVVGTSGRHMAIYVNKDSLLPHPLETFKVTRLLAEIYKDSDIDVVVAPATAGIALGHLVAYHLSEIQKKEVLSIYAEKTAGGEGPLVFKRGYEDIIKGKKALLIDDTIATGSSIHKIIDAVKTFGGHVSAVGVFANRIPEKVNTQALGVPLSWLCEIPAETFAAEDCPLCKANVPINTKVGHGKKFLEEKHGDR